MLNLIEIAKTESNRVDWMERMKLPVIFHQRRLNRTYLSQAVSFKQLSWIASSLLVMSAVIHLSWFVFLKILLIFSAILALRMEIARGKNQGQKNRGYSLVIPSQILIFIVVVFVWWSEILSGAAMAQFFQGGEDWMSGQFPEAGGVIPLVFNVLRGIFLIYVGIALVKVINAVRQDEDWQTLARQPLIILICITLGDVLTNLIVGGGA
ncbi:MAG: hypothetical protein ACRC8Y_13470 [Chroococcales cyanobacterium]